MQQSMDDNAHAVGLGGCRADVLAQFRKPYIHESATCNNQALPALPRTPILRAQPRTTLLPTIMIRGLRILRYAILALVIIVVIWKFSTNASSVDLQSYPKSLGLDKFGVGGAASQAPPSQGTTQQSTQAVATPEIQRENATFVTLARNGDLWGLVGSIREVEDRFNHKYHYDWVFLNDDDFTEEFKQVTSKFVSGKTSYGKIPKEHWGYPEWIDQGKASEARAQMQRDGIIYGWSESYRHMCRFESGFFWRNPALDNYKYYWRVEPHIKLTCDIPNDPFRYMREKGKKYGFAISLYEYKATIETLWDTVKGFIRKFPEHIHQNNGMKFISDDGGESYNLCHFWSNFEIGDLDFWRGDAYRAFFDYLDHAGGFFYERWGDAPVHSIAAALLLDKEEIHYFQDIGYWHVPFQNCPVNKEERLELKCTCPQDEALADDQRYIFTFKGYSCTDRWYKMLGKPFPAGYEQHK